LFDISTFVSTELNEPVTVGNYPVELDGTLDSTGTTLTGTLNLDGTRVIVVMQRK
jgi:hypothetical protein